MIPTTHLREIARGFQRRATDARKLDASNERLEYFALGLDAAAASLLEEYRELETARRRVLAGAS